MPDNEETVEAVARAASWDDRVALVRQVPEQFGTQQHQTIYAQLAERIYVPTLAPNFAYIHWRDDYKLSPVEDAYSRAKAVTGGFQRVTVADLQRAIESEPVTLRVFRLLLGLTTQEFAASTALVSDELRVRPVTNGQVKSMEAGSPPRGDAAQCCAEVIDRAMRGSLFAAPAGDVRSKLDKPDTVAGWETVRNFDRDGVPLPVLLHQRHYGGAFRQLLDATSTKRGDVLEEAVEELFTSNGIPHIRTGSANQEEIARRFGLTIRPAPDFVVYDDGGRLRAILECKGANDGGTARDKAARFRSLRQESMRLGGIPLFAVLEGLGWRRTADALGPVVRDTDGRVFTIPSLPEMLTVDPFPHLRK